MHFRNGETSTVTILDPCSIEGTLAIFAGLFAQYMSDSPFESDLPLLYNDFDANFAISMPHNAFAKDS